METVHIVTCTWLTAQAEIQKAPVSPCSPLWLTRTKVHWWEIGEYSTGSPPELEASINAYFLRNNAATTTLLEETLLVDRKLTRLVIN